MKATSSWYEKVGEKWLLFKKHIMKNMSLFSLLCIVGLLPACGGGDEDSMPPETPDKPGTPDEVVLTVSPSALDAMAVEGTYEIKVTTTGEGWTARSTDKWVSLTPESGEGKGEVIKVTVEQNKDAERYGRITVTSGKKSEYVQVKQKGGIRFSVQEVLCTSGAGNAEVTVYESNDWNVQSDADWVTVSRNDAHVIVSYTANVSLTSRTAAITVAGEGQERTFLVIQEGAEVTTVPEREGYKLVWHDEFTEGAELNAAHWRHEVQNAGWVNNELQNYVNGVVNGKRVTELSDGKLRIHCFKESDGKIYSGRVYAHETEGWQYGYIEARMMLPKGKGTWPAFWMMPVNVDWATEGWPKCGEIDIMEEVGVVPNEVSSSLHAEGHNHTNGTQVTHAMTIDKAEGEFHTYAMEWTPQNITTYVDGKVQLTYDNDNKGVTNWPYDKPYYIIFNLAWGGSWGGMQGVDESALPISLVIDYVRVFQKK